MKTAIGSFTQSPAPATTEAVDSHGTVYVPVSTPGSDSTPLIATGVVKAFHPDGQVVDTAWSFAWPSHGGSGNPLSLAVDGTGNLYGFVVTYDEQTSVMAQQVWELPVGANGPVLMPFSMPDVQLADYSFDADLVVTPAGDVIAKNLVDSSLWILRSGETTPVALPSAGFDRVLDLEMSRTGALYALGSNSDGTRGISRLLSGAASWESLPVDSADPAVANGSRITVDDLGNIYTLGSHSNRTVMWRLPAAETPSEEVTTFASSSQYAEMETDGHQAVIVAPSTERNLISIEVRPLTVVASDSYLIVRGSTPLSLDAHDLNDDSLTFQATTEPTHGTLSGNHYPGVTYTPNAGYLGRDSITYKVTSINGTSATATVTLSVRKPLVVSGDGWTQTTIYDVDSYTDFAPYGVTVDDSGTVMFPIVDPNTGVGSVVAQAPNGTRTNTAWTIGDNYLDYPYSLDADAQGNLYGTVVANGSGAVAARMLPTGGDHAVPLPFPTETQSSGTPPAIAASAAGDVVMSDWVAAKVYILRAGSNTPTTLPLPSGFRPTDIDVGRDDDVYIVGTIQVGGQSQSEVIRMGLDGSGTQVIGAPTNQPTFGVGVSDGGTVYLATYLPGESVTTIARMDAQGNLVAVSGPLDLYNSWNSVDVGRDSAVYVSEIWGTRLMRIDFGSPNSPPTVSDSTRSVRGNQSSGLVLSASDPDGDDLSYAITGNPAHGSLAGTAPDLTYTPNAGYLGPDAMTYSVDDGNGGTASASVAITVTDPETGVSSVSQPVSEGQTVATGPEPTADEPTQAAVTTPVAGDVTITQDPSVADPAGYAIVGTQYRIEAPQTSPTAPLRLQFQIAEDELPAGQGPDALAVFRDGVAIESCADDSGTATPDPCISSRSTADGVITLTVLSSHASGWTLAVKQLATTTTVTPVATSTYGQAISLTAIVAQAGSVKPTGTVEFRDTSVSPVKALGAATLSADGTARLGDLRLSAGTHSIVASYSGSATSLPSASAPVTLNVAKAPVVVTTSSTSGAMSLLSLRISYSTTVKSGVTGQPVAGVSVTTRISGGASSTGCTAVTNSNGVATCTAGPINLALGGSYTASTAETANYRAGSATAKVPLL